MNLPGTITKLAGVAAICAAAVAAAQAPGVTIQFKNIEVPGALYTTPVGINNANSVVGYYVDAGGVTHGFVMMGSTATTIDDPNGTATFCEGINSSGAIVGEYTQPDGNNHGFLYEGGEFTDVGTGGISGAFGINDAGIIVGGFLKCGLCAQEGFEYDGTTYTTLKVPGSSYTSATGINNEGLITITSADANANYHGYIYNGTKYTKIDPPGYTDVYAGGINNLGDVAMTAILDQGQEEFEYGAVLHQGQYVFFTYDNRPKVLTRNSGINDNRISVGGFETKQTIGGFVARASR